jgi:Bacterial mobilisation protein (MobC)
MPRPQVIGFRLSPEEHAHLAAAARASGLTPATWSRRAVLDQLAAGSGARGASAGAAAAGDIAPPAAASRAPAAATAPATSADTAAAAAAAAAATEPLSRVVGAKLTPSQYFDLEVRAKAAGVTIGTYLRRLVAGRPPTGRWPLARAAILQLSKVGTNLNQLVKLAHQGTPLPRELAIAVESVLGEVRGLRRALQAEPRE